MPNSSLSPDAPVPGLGLGTTRRSEHRSRRDGGGGYGDRREYPIHPPMNVHEARLLFLAYHPWR
jgi:hypothetical protein